MYRKQPLYVLLIIFLFVSAVIYADEQTKSFLEILFNSVNPLESVDETSSDNSLIEALVKEQQKSEALIEELEEMRASDSGTSSAAEPVVKDVETIVKSAAAGETFIFEANGEGWMLDGYSDPSGEVTANLRYSGREYIGGNTVFSFYPYKPGDYLINIRKTDYEAGIVERRMIELSVVQGLQQEPEEAVSVVEEEEPTAAENEQQAEQELLVHDAADVAAKMEVLPQVYNTAAEAAKIASGLETAGACSDAAEVLEKYLENPGLKDVDMVLYMLAGYYENCPEIRDERRAVSYYRQIVDYYPISNYWTKARERCLYLERQYIYIR